MASDKDEELDEHGLVVQKYVSTVLVVMPTSGYSETTLRYARSALYNVHVGTRTVSADDAELLQGELQDEFQVDGPISGVSMDEYSGVIFCGGAGSQSLAEDADALRLAKEAAAQDKLIGAWGLSVAVLAKAGVVKKRRLTGDPSLKGLLEGAGARFRGTQVETDGKLVTALDDAAGFRFGKALVQVVAIGQG